MAISTRSMVDAPSSASINLLTAPTSALGKVDDILSTVCMSGRLLHNESKINPLSHMKVKLYENKFFSYENKFLNIDSKITSSKTDDEGKFQFVIPRDFLSKSLYILIRGNNERTVRIDLVKGESNLNDILVEYYEYDKSFPRERKPPAGTGVLSDPIDLPYTAALGVGAGPWLILSASLLTVIDNLSVDEVQNAFSVFSKNLTVRMEENPETAGLIHTGAWLGDRIFNGFNPGHLLKGERPGTFLLEYNWDRYEMDNTERNKLPGEDTPYALPNAKCHLRMEGARLVAYKVELQSRILPIDSTLSEPLRKNKVSPPVFNKKTRQLDHSRLSNWQVVTEETPELFKTALKIFRIAYSASGEIDRHLATHLKIGEMAMAYNRMGTHIIGKVIGPHFAGVDKINNLGVDVIFGPKGVLATSTALTPKGLQDRFKMVLGHMDFLNWSPRKPISDADTYAKGANLYWGIVNNWVAIFISKNKIELENNWGQIKKMSDELVLNSVARHRLDGKKRSDWADPSEVDPKGAKPKKILINGKLKRKSISPITVNDFPVDVDWMNLMQYCSYSIFFATFEHSWVHDLQKDDLGDINYATIGMKEGGKPPEPIDALDQLKLAYALPAFEFGYIIKNEYGDIQPEFIEMLLKHKDQFEAIGLNPLNIRSRIII